MIEFLAEQYERYPLAWLFGPSVFVAAGWAAFVNPVLDLWAAVTNDFESLDKRTCWPRSMDNARTVPAQDFELPDRVPAPGRRAA